MNKTKCKFFFAATGLTILILDSKTASYGASQGINLCLSTVIPSLFPFIFMSSVLVGILRDKPIGFFQRIAHLFGMSAESFSYFIVGLLGGYPTGAACIAEHYRRGALEKHQAELMLGFCNNAGPAFLFGIAGALFSRGLSCVLWLVHILSAVLTFLLLPKTHVNTIEEHRESKEIPISAVLVQSVKSMGAICGWIILFRVLIAFCDKWFLWLLPKVLQVAFYGIVELSNGCCSLEQIDSSAVSFLLFSCFLSLGGLCVAMQTKTVAAPLSLHWYMIGKCIQCLTCLILCGLLIPLLFPAENIASQTICLIFIPAALIYVIIGYFPKKTVDFPSSVIYTKEKIG